MSVDWHAVTGRHDEDLASYGNTGVERERTIAYLARLWQTNQELNLVSRRMTPAALMTDHVLDCLTALPYLPPVAFAADLGTGGGLPAILLAIHRPKTTWLLYEKSPLKRRFLQSLTEVCPNIEICGSLTENALDARVELVTARGFKPLAGILALTRDYHARGGAYALYKARAAKIDDERRAAGLTNDDLIVQALPTFGQVEERHLVMINLQPPPQG